MEGFGGLRLTEQCRPLLRGETTLLLRRDLTPQTKSTRSASQASQLVRSDEREMWEALRTLRRQLAEEHSVPPYVIFPDSTLLEMLREQPEDLDDMAQISGVGARKLERYGAAFLKVLNQQDSPAAPAAPNSQDLRHELVTLARSGMTPEQISQQMQCSLKNVYSLMAQAISGNLLSLEEALDLPEELLGSIQDAFLQGDGELPSVASVAEQFTPQIEEGVLYCVRAALQAEFGSMV